MHRRKAGAEEQKEKRRMDQKEYLELKEKELRDALGTVHAIQTSKDPTVVYKDSRPITDLKNMIETSAKEFGDRPAFWQKKSRKDAYAPITYRQYLEDINALGTTLIAMGQKDKRIGVIGANCYQWAVAYMAIVCGTGVVVPLDKELPVKELKQQVIEAEISCVISAKKHVPDFVEMKNSGDTKLSIIIDMEAEADLDPVRSMICAINEGKDMIRAGNTAFLEAQIIANEMSVLLFTSGTTGIPKGVMLSHRNICEDLMIAPTVLTVHPSDIFFSVLPLHHTYECTCGFLMPLYKGASIAYCEGLKYILTNIAECKPTMLLGVPAIFEMFYKRIWANARKNGKEDKLRMALRISRASRKVGIDLRKKLFKEIHAVFGGNMRILISGGAAINPAVLDGFTDFGILAVQGYGLTEASPMGALNPDTAPNSRSIGRAFPHCHLKIDHPDEDGIGEICIKGDNIMLGYYKRPDLTEEVIIDGWFHTGDLGYIDSEGYAYITGRKKNVIITKNGKNVFPEELEYYLNNVDLIEESVVFAKEGAMGDDDIIAAYIKVDEEYLAENFETPPTEEELMEMLWKEVDRINRENPPYKQIRTIKIRKEEFIKNSSKKIRRFEKDNTF